jgi:uncharacterized protein (UPF0332 family)
MAEPEKEGELDARFANAFKGVFDDRMDADYGLKYSENTAREAIAVAEDFNKGLKELIDKNQ